MRAIATENRKACVYKLNVKETNAVLVQRCVETGKALVLVLMSLPGLMVLKDRFECTVGCPSLFSLSLYLP